MWPKTVDWKSLAFGIEIEFIAGNPKELKLLPSWVMSLDEQQIDETGTESGSELPCDPVKMAMNTTPQLTDSHLPFQLLVG
jgi:hypothetical protein